MKALDNDVVKILAKLIMERVSEHLENIPWSVSDPTQNAHGHVYARFVFCVKEHKNAVSAFIFA